MQKSRNTKLIVLEGVISNLLFGTLLVWSVLRNPFLALFPAWNEGMLSIIFGIHNLFTCFGLMAGGWLCSRFPTRRIYLLYMIMTIIGLIGFAFLPEAHPKLAYLMAAGFFWLAATGIGIGINVIQSTTIPWFPNNSGAISGALYMALGVSSVGLVALLESTSGTVLDISGSYLPVMVMVAVLAILAALLALIFGKLFRTKKHC